MKRTGFNSDFSYSQRHGIKTRLKNTVIVYLLTSNRFVSGSANLSNTNLISVHSSWDLNSWRYLQKQYLINDNWREMVSNSPIERLVFPHDCFLYSRLFKWNCQILWIPPTTMSGSNSTQHTNLLNNEWAVCRTPLIMWKSPLPNFTTSSLEKEICTKHSNMPFNYFMIYSLSHSLEIHWPVFQYTYWQQVCPLIRKVFSTYHTDSITKLRKKKQYIRTSLLVQ